MTPKRFLYLFFGIPQFKELFAAIAAKDQEAVKEWFHDDINCGVVTLWPSLITLTASTITLVLVLTR